MSPRPLPLSAILLLPFSVLMVLCFFADVFFPAVVQREWWWMGYQLYPFPYLLRGLVIAAPLLVLLIPAKSFSEAGNSFIGYREKLRPYFKNHVLVVILGLLLLWVFRSVNLVVGDAHFYVSDLIPREAFSERGVFLNYDSMGTSAMYSIGFRYAHRLFDMACLTWYNIVGLLSLAAFLWWAWHHRNRGWVLLTPTTLLLLFLGNWSQTTLGPAEHYGQVYLLIAVFAILSIECLRGKAPLWMPCLAFSLGAFFHLMIGWIFPALVYLAIQRWKTQNLVQKQYTVVALLLPAFFAGYLGYFLGFDLSFMSSTNSASGKLIPFLDENHPRTGPLYHYPTFDIRHLTHILLELILTAWPAIILLVGGAPYLDWRRLFKDKPFIFLVIAFGGAFSMNLFWNPDLGFWRDQDLFAIIGLAACLLAIYIFAENGPIRIEPDTRKRLIAAAIIGALCWRMPVVLWHSVLDPNYLDPKVVFLEYPYDDLTYIPNYEIFRGEEKLN